jgi:ribosomal protein L12E/L44/L45/RPP1/RPP2
MKTALVRILTIATLSTSLSAFAATDESKTDNAAVASATQQQDGCGASHKEKKQKKAKSQRDDQRTEQEKEFDRVLMGYFG